MISPEAATLPSKKRETKPSTSIQQDYRALLERQRKLIKQLNTQKPESSKEVNKTFTAPDEGPVMEQSPSHTRVNSYDVTSRRAMATAQSQPTQHFFIDSNGAFVSPTSTAAVAFQEKYMKPYKKRQGGPVYREGVEPHPPSEGQESTSPTQRRE